MGEGTAPVAVSQRPDTFDVRREFIIHLDIAALVGLDTRLVEAEIIGVGPPADRKKHM